ncbi:MAG TPA: Uma2 family endonuclease [Bryobacteraceae bacterium]|nr:Uma2 family endonuclease [Bryobacteraceae bacterium]
MRKWAMASVARKLTFVDFQRQYGRSDRAYEYWYGEAIIKGMPTWIHGLLQKIIMTLLDEAGYKSGSEVELRIDPEAHPKPDVIATKGRIELPYPTRAVDVVVEVLSEDDTMPYMRAKCRAYRRWGFTHIYLVDPADRSVLEWMEGSLIVRDELATIPVERIWAALDAQIGGES